MDYTHKKKEARQQQHSNGGSGTSTPNSRKKQSAFHSQVVDIVLKNQQLVQTLANIEDVGSEDSEVEDNESQYNANGSLAGDFVDLGDVIDFGAEGDVDSFWERLFAKFASFGAELLDALSETNEDLKDQDEGPPPLNIRQLKRNSKRCTVESKPYLELMAGLQDILHWKNPLATFTLFSVYMYCVWKGWLVSVVLFLVLFQLILNYLSQRRKICLGISFLPRKEVECLKLDGSGAQLVVDISRRAQVVLEIGCDVLEKVKNLFTWEKPETTVPFVMLVSFFFCLSICVSMSTFFTVVGFGVGMKLFVTTYLFYRFPRLRQKLDVMVWFLDRLPTNKKARFRRQLSGKRYSVANALLGATELGEIATFSESFQAPQVEVPKIVRRCIMVDKEKSFPYTVGSGSLVVTESHIFFKYGRLNGGKREIIKLSFDNILAVLRAKAIKLSFMPVHGKAIEIYTPGRSKVGELVFCWQCFTIMSGV